MDETSRKMKATSGPAGDKKKDAKLFYVYRPNTGQQVKQVGAQYFIIYHNFVTVIISFL